MFLFVINEGGKDSVFKIRSLVRGKFTVEYFAEIYAFTTSQNLDSSYKIALVFIITSQLLCASHSPLYSHCLSPAFLLIFKMLVEVLIYLRKGHLRGIDGRIVSEGCFKEKRFFFSKELIDCSKSLFNDFPTF
jgi:hypothetical protein